MDFSLNEEQETIRQAVRDFARKEVAPKAVETDRSAEFPRGSVKRMAELGLFGMTLPPPLGGSGAGLTGLLVAVEELAAVCASTAMILMPHVMVEQAILVFGTDAQKGRYLPQLARGEKLAAVAATEAMAGTDFAAIRCSARPEGDGYVLDGSKMFICNAGEADVYLVMARSTEAEGAGGLSMFVVEGDTPGLQIGKAEDKFGIRGVPSKEVSFDGCRIPGGSLLGAPGMGLVQQSVAGTPITLAVGAISVGIARAAMEEAIEYAKQRKACDRPIGSFEAVQTMITDMVTKIDASRLLIYRAASSVEKRQPNPTEVFAAKLFSGEMALEVTNNAMQIFGGYGYTKELPLERYYRDARAFTVYPFPSEIYRTIFARMVLGLPMPWKGMPPMGPPGGPPGGPPKGPPGAAGGPPR